MNRTDSHSLSKEGLNMKKVKTTHLIACTLVTGTLLLGCAASNQVQTEPVAVPVRPTRTQIEQIDSFRPEVASSQALEVVNNNPYEQRFYEEVFARLVDQCRNSTSQENADLIWSRFVEPLRRSGKVPPDLATSLWNQYFSRQFVSLPSMGGMGENCRQLAEVKKNLESEYKLKRAGFEVCQQGSPDTHFLNAMYVYNTMWAACNDAD
jgi:hypothetical protein